MSHPFDAMGRPLAAVAGARKPNSTPTPFSVNETALVGIVTLNLVFLPWALGGMHAWSQIVSLVLSVTGLIIALLSSRQGNTSDHPMASLLRFPVFWFGMFVLAYMAMQGLNPSWQFETDSKSWWLVPVSHVPHLPSGVDAPFARSNSWRAITIDGSAWLLICSIWSGFARRRNFRWMFGALVLSGSLLAAVGLAQQLTGTGEVFWGYRAPEKSLFMATFIYRNHAGAYFDLVLALAVGLSSWHWRRAQQRLEGPGAAVAFGFSAMLIGLGVIFSASRMSIVLMIVFTVFTGLGLATSLLFGSKETRRRHPWVTLALPVFCLGAIALISFEAGGVSERFAALIAKPSATLSYRDTARRAAIEMLRDQWVFGWGAGCFRYGFPIYAQRYPEIYDSGNGRRFYWEHAHDDLVEFPLELGAVGMIPIATGLLFAGWKLIRVRFWRNPVSFCLAVGCFLTLVHASVDFVFQNPAVMTTWLVFLFGAIRWAELDATVERRRVALAM